MSDTQPTNTPPVGGVPPADAPRSLFESLAAAVHFLTQYLVFPDFVLGINGDGMFLVRLPGEEDDTSSTDVMFVSNPLLPGLLAPGNAEAQHYYKTLLEKVRAAYTKGLGFIPQLDIPAIAVNREPISFVASSWISKLQYWYKTPFSDAGVTRKGLDINSLPESLSIHTQRLGDFFQRFVVLGAQLGVSNKSAYAFDVFTAGRVGGLVSEPIIGAVDADGRGDEDIVSTAKFIASSDVHELAFVNSVSEIPRFPVSFARLRQLAKYAQQYFYDGKYDQAEIVRQRIFMTVGGTLAAMALLATGKSITMSLVVGGVCGAVAGLSLFTVITEFFPKVVPESEKELQ